MADRAHSTSRRALLAGLSVTPAMSRPLAAFALSTAAGAGGVLAASRALGAEAAPPHPDAALLAHEAGFMRLAAAADAAITAEFAAEARAHDLARTRWTKAMGDWAWAEALHGAQAEIGYDALEEATSQAHQALDEAASRVGALRATTLDGLRAKARMQRHHEDLSLSIAEDLRALDAADGAVA